jgi:hypothetical protein
VVRGQRVRPLSCTKPQSSSRSASPTPLCLRGVFLLVERGGPPRGARTYHSPQQAVQGFGLISPDPLHRMPFSSSNSAAAVSGSSSSAACELELTQPSGDIADVLRKMPERERAQAVQDDRNVLNDLGQKHPGAGGVDGEEEGMSPAHAASVFGSRLDAEALAPAEMDKTNQEGDIDPSTSGAAAAAAAATTPPPSPPPLPMQSPQDRSKQSQQKLKCGCQPSQCSLPGRDIRCAEWYLLECTTECKQCKETDRRCGFGSSDGFNSHAAGDLDWKGILDDVELLPLMETLQAMQGQKYRDSKDYTQKEFQLDNQVAKGEDKTVRQLVEDYLKIERWTPQAKLSKNVMMMGADNIAAIRVWSSEGAQVFSKTSVPITLARHSHA